MPQLLTKSVSPDNYTKTAFGSFSAAVDQAHAVSLIIFGADRQCMRVTNTTDKDLAIATSTSAGAGTLLDYIPAGAAQTYDFGADLLVLASGAQLYGFFPGGSAPTSGYVLLSMVL